MPVVDPPGVAAAAAPGPCGWTLDTGCDSAWASYSAEVQERATALAVLVLDAATGRQFGQCPITVRPCGPTCTLQTNYVTYPVSAPAGNVPGPWMTPYIANGVWSNCACAGGCSCEPACRVDLRVPVAEVLEVKVHGLVLDPSAWTLTGQWLARTDGGECWPACQDPSVPDTADDTFSVTFRPGRLLPAAGQYAAGLLASEFAKACQGAACGLPPQIAALSRQGVDVEFVNPTEVFTNGQTGIREVDLFIRAVNPHNLGRRPRVLSPDVKPHPVSY